MPFINSWHCWQSWLLRRERPGRKIRRECKTAEGQTLYHGGKESERFPCVFPRLSSTPRPDGTN